MDALGDAIVAIAPDWRVRYVNAPWERILGVPRLQAIGSDFWSVYPGFCVEPGASMIRATAGDGATRRFDLEHWLAGELRSYGARVSRDDTGCVVLSVTRAFHTVKSTRDRTLEDRNEEPAICFIWDNDAPQDGDGIESRILTRTGVEVVDLGTADQWMEGAGEGCEIPADDRYRDVFANPANYIVEFRVVENQGTPVTGPVRSGPLQLVSG